MAIFLNYALCFALCAATVCNITVAGVIGVSSGINGLYVVNGTFLEHPYYHNSVSKLFLCHVLSGGWVIDDELGSPVFWAFNLDDTPTPELTTSPWKVWNRPGSFSPDPLMHANCSSALFECNARFVYTLSAMGIIVLGYFTAERVK